MSLASRRSVRSVAAGFLGMVTRTNCTESMSTTCITKGSGCAWFGLVPSAYSPALLRPSPSGVGLGGGVGTGRAFGKIGGLPNLERRRVEAEAQVLKRLGQRVVGPQPQRIVAIAGQGKRRGQRVGVGPSNRLRGKESGPCGRERRGQSVINDVG